MAIITSDFEWRKAQNNSDAPENGGLMGAEAMADDVKNNLLPDVTQAQRLAGLTRYRKLFALVLNADNLALQNAFAFLSKVSEGDDFFALFAGSQTDTQADIASPRLYAAAVLAADAASGDSSFDLTLENVSLGAGFQDGDSIWIGTDTAGEFFHNATFALSGATVTVTLAAGDALATAYTAGDARCASMLPAAADIAAGAADWTETSSSGGYDESAHPLEVQNIGCSEDEWLLTFTSETAFTVEGLHAGALPPAPRTATTARQTPRAASTSPSAQPAGAASGRQGTPSPLPHTRPPSPSGSRKLSRQAPPQRASAPLKSPSQARAADHGRSPQRPAGRIFGRH